jgi:hypothetical protein
MNNPFEVQTQTPPPESGRARPQSVELGRTDGAAKLMEPSVTPEQLTLAFLAAEKGIDQ